jgi:hypothetical protein
MIVSGVGTDHFEWGEGYPLPSYLDFTGSSFDTETENIFSFGDLEYYNGTIISGTGAESVDLSVTLDLSTPTGIESFDYQFGLINTPNTPDPAASADYVIFPNALPTNTFLVDGVDYTLELIGFGEVSGGGYSIIDEFHVLEGSSARAQLLGRITSNIPQSVPEPSTVTSLLFGSIFFIFGMIKKSKKS